MKQSSPLVRAILIAIVLGLVVYLGAKSLFLPEQEEFAQQEFIEPTVSVLVTSNRVRQGHVMSSLDMEWREMPEGKTPSGQEITDSDQPDAIGALTGRMSVREIPPGTPITSAMLLDPSNRVAAKLRPGMRAMAISIEPHLAAGGLILPDDRVDLTVTEQIEKDILISEEGVEGTTQTVYLNSWVIMENLRVIAIDQQIMQNEDETSIVGATATLEIPAEHITTIAKAAMTTSGGERMLNVALRGMINPDGSPVETYAVNEEFAQEQESDLGEQVTIIGFGRSVKTTVETPKADQAASSIEVPELSALELENSLNAQSNAELPAPTLLGEIDNVSSSNGNEVQFPRPTNDVDTSMALPGFEIEQDENALMQSDEKLLDQ